MTVNLSPGDLVTLTVIIRHGSSGNWNHFPTSFTTLTSEEAFAPVMSLFLSELFNCCVKHFTSSTNGYEHFEPKTAFYC